MDGKSEKIADANEEFSVRTIAHEIVERYHPIHIGTGGESLVYVSIRNREDLEGIKNVIKVRKASLIKCVQWQLKNPALELEDYEEIGRSSFEDYTSGRKADLNELRDYFGRQAVPVERHIYTRVPVTKNIMHECFYDTEEDPDEMDFDDIQESYATLTAQTFQGDLSSEGSFLNIGTQGRIETELEESEYLKFMGGLVFRDNSVDIASVVDMAVDRSESLDKLLDRCSSDETIREQVLLFIKNACNYSRDTGKIMDLTFGNVIIKDSGTTQLILLDALIEKDIRMDMNSLPDVWPNLDISSQFGPRVFHVLNYIRILNTINYKLTGELAINVFDEVSSLDDATVAKVCLLRKEVKKMDPVLGWLYAIFAERDEEQKESKES